MLGPVVFMYSWLGIVEFGFQAAVASALDFGARSAGRAGITGTKDVTGTAASAADRASAVRAAVLHGTGDFLQDGQLTISVQSYGSIADEAANKNGASGNGASGQYVVYSLTYVQPPFTGTFIAGLIGKSSFTYTSTVLVTNEPFQNN